MFVLGLEEGFQEGYKMGLQDGWSKDLMMAMKKHEEAVQITRKQAGSMK